MNLDYIPYRIFSYYTEIKDLIKGKSIRPRFADLHTSNRCNHRCNGCAYKDMHDGNVMSRDDHFTIVNNLIDFGISSFDFAGGGEPLMIPYLPELLLHITNRKCHFGIITNGSLLTDDLIDIIAECGTYIRISLEASNRLVFSEYKNVPPEQWDNTLNNITKLVSKNGNADVSIKFAVGKSLNGPMHYEDGLKLADDLGVDGVQFKLLRHEPEELSYEEIEHEYSIGPLHLGGYSCDRYEVPDPCWLNPLHTMVDHTGNAYICCYYYYRSEQHMIGNLLQHPIEYYWMKDDHMSKIKNISPYECSKVDCKFFRHHDTVDKYIHRLDFL